MATIGYHCWHEQFSPSELLRYVRHAETAGFKTAMCSDHFRPWPLLIGERAHYELAKGDSNRVDELIAAMAAYAGEVGIISEQIWDADDLPDKRLFRGQPTGSASPLLWAHSEYLKLLRSIRDQKVFDLPPQADRYQGVRPSFQRTLWRIEHAVETLPAGSALRIEVPQNVTVNWCINGGEYQSLDNATQFFGLRVADLAIESLVEGDRITLTVSCRDSDGVTQTNTYHIKVH